MLHVTSSKNEPKSGYYVSLEEETTKNTDFRRVLFTTDKSQLVVMSLTPGEDIGSEVHDLDQFIRFESGHGEISMDGFRHKVKGGDAILVPSGTKHNVVNTSKTETLKLYAIYSPPNHKRGTVHRTKSDVKEEHFDGETDLN